MFMIMIWSPFARRILRRAVAECSETGVAVEKSGSQCLSNRANRQGEARRIAHPEQT
jgi:hypothetical protein